MRHEVHRWIRTIHVRSCSPDWSQTICTQVDSVRVERTSSGLQPATSPCRPTVQIFLTVKVLRPQKQSRLKKCFTTKASQITPTGLEPVSPGWKPGHLTVLVYGARLQRPDSNRHSSPYEGAALPIEPLCIINLSCHGLSWGQSPCHILCVTGTVPMTTRVTFRATGTWLKAMPQLPLFKTNRLRTWSVSSASAGVGTGAHTED